MNASSGGQRTENGHPEKWHYNIILCHTPCMTGIWHYNILLYHTAYILKNGTIIYICHKRYMTGTKSLSSDDLSVPKIWHYNIYVSHCVLRYAVAALARRLMSEKWVKQYQIIQITHNLWKSCGKVGNVVGICGRRKGERTVFLQFFYGFLRCSMSPVASLWFSSGFSPWK